ncbi:DUF2490 domain-containing protein [Muricauda sp. JGD-17]|uniref:DUF2490 domain-containing protein n=1 Tax=Flagellimonas ochracea TaxID=2696472 RepID=A0A964WYA8_9FLAO|nr:DUF2490 domain-containing protein [Allomuricauda ochracea]NAY92722.1 DUF2490 domain-containing protein [Allomuricauda ochracea]
MILSTNTQIHEHWSIPVVGILKHRNMLDNYGFTFVRTGTTFKLSEHSSLTGGIAFLNCNIYSGQEEASNNSQLWYYGEYSLKLGFGKAVVAQRFRLENRRTTNTEHRALNNRARYRLQYTRQLSKKFYFKSFNEVFLQLENSSFDQNRFYIGVGQSLSPSTKIDIGYFNQQHQNTNESMVRMGISINIDFTNKDLALKSGQNQLNP